jgi:hypothetical protein
MIFLVSIKSDILSKNSGVSFSDRYIAFYTYRSLSKQKICEVGRKKTNLKGSIRGFQEMHIKKIKFEFY